MITLNHMFLIISAISIVSIISVFSLVYADTISTYEHFIKNIINWKNEGKITNDSMNKALDWIVEKSNNKEDTIKLITKSKLIGKTQTLLVQKSNEPVDSEYNLLVKYQFVSIPSEELLDVCTHRHVLDRSYENLRYKCDSAMEMMMRDYCNFNSQYTETLCRDKRIDQYYGREVKSENIPSESKIENMKQTIIINDLSFQVTDIDIVSSIGNPYTVQIHLELKNTGKSPIYISKEDFQLIDTKGTIMNIEEFFKDSDNINEIGEIEKILPNENIKAWMFTHSLMPKDNILKLSLDNQEKFVKLTP